ncbi:DegT/DnrJ/EryC1/StrS family aminotransferase [Anoxybacillus sp. J5B_2022]|uniref:DegT/DnrJ/EryC1/StrS family aminotransferase n=1 Tax=Anoxybacillus sp. J5B_2022 TaxID=3003246 RepID=UPI00228542CE|nr:DegT/DnrJ/EryC1/StrS family aminotransferase [Anoxybacillus sp. J5B_2022]MCZ0756139.1 DegT/DnrJ/EryC1/StrS family aminotransferase [Anoxybacillus sp. J5B_2022]
MKVPVRKELAGNFYGSYLIGNEEIKEVTEVLKSQSIFRYYGPNLLGKTDRFEQDLMKFHNVQYALGVSSGTAALKCALKALGVGTGDEVIVPAYGFIATAGSVVSCNAIPIFCDVDTSLNLDPYDLERHITNRTKAIIVVHIMGVAANMTHIKSIADKYGIPIIEDVAQSFGGSYKGKRLGVIGDVGCFSFQANKILSTGEGGALITNNEKLYKRAKIYHDQGAVRIGNSFPNWNDESFFGENYRMNEITAAIGIAQLKKIPTMLNKLKRQKLLLRKIINRCDINYRSSWDDNGDCGISECFFVEDLDKRDEIIKKLRELGINAHGYYSCAVYENKLFLNISDKYNYLDKQIDSEKKNRYKTGDCPKAEKLSRQAVWIPISPLYSDDDIKYIGEILKKYVT